MLSKLIVNSYKVLIEIALWCSLVLTLGMGIVTAGVIGLLIGGVAWLIFSALLFGAFLILIDIRDRVKSIETQQYNQTVPNHD